MVSKRPGPDELLARVQAEERKQKRGRLTIFFAAAPGVGKTFAMLIEAGFQRDVEDRDVAVGVVETHGRFETTTLLAGFERLPKQKLEYRGTTLEEFDLDAALARRPSLLLLDELAHTNPEGSRHKKRWQDVEELLDAGIDVMTTLNVQHVESLNDVVAQITGVVVRETVPDSVIDAADEIKLIDLPPDELIGRLREGKVYVPAQIERAMENFFRKGNLIALRELALRKTAERVDADMQAWRRAQGIEKTWAASDRLLVCISPSPHSSTLLRVGRRMAAGLHADWFAVTVQTPATLRLSAEDRARTSGHLRFAEELGAETVTLTGEQAAESIIKFAREHNITKILVGKPRIFRFRDRFGKSFVDQLILGSGDIDVYVTAGEAERANHPSPPPQPARGHEATSYAASLVVVALATILGSLLFGREQLADVAMTYLLGVVVVSTRFSFRASVLGAVLSVLAFDFFFVSPYLTFTVSDARHAVTFLVMLLVAVVIAGLNQRVRDQARVALTSERRTAMLYALSRELSRSLGRGELVRVAGRQLEDAFESNVVVFTVEQGRTQIEYATPGFDAPLANEEGVMRWVWNHHREAGLGTDTLAGSRGYYHALIAPDAQETILGIFGVYPKDPDRFRDLEQRRLADAFATQIALAIERTRLAEETAHARLQIEAEQVRSTLLSSVSHDLRTPLAVMKGAASTLVDDELELKPEARRELAQALLEETDRLDQLVRDLLDMTRLESGSVRLKKEWHSVEEVLGAALTRTESRLGKRPIITNVRGDLLAWFDAVLVQQLLVNLLENAAKYTPDATPIEISAQRIGDELIVEIADRGPGIAAGDEAAIFEKFRRGALERAKSGTGLGLTICRAIAVAHGGRIWGENRSGGGACFKFALPLRGQPPPVALPEVTNLERIS
jgi:two-component system, OmpR family, sensor histidine kinase KdpD